MLPKVDINNKQQLTVWVITPLKTPLIPCTEQQHSNQFITCIEFF